MRGKDFTQEGVGKYLWDLNSPVLQANERDRGRGRARASFSGELA